MPSLVIYEGSVYHDPHADTEFEVLEAPEPGASDNASVVVEYEDGQRASMPYDHFTGPNSFELIEQGDQYPSGTARVA